MDTTISNCPKCGHAVNATATACTYCGAALSSGDSSPQPGEKAPGTAAQPVTPPPLPTDDSPPVLDMTEVSAGTPEVSEVQSDTEPSSQVQPEETRTEINEPAAKAVSGAQAQSPVEERIVESDAAETAKDPEPDYFSDTIAIEIKKPKMKPDPASDPDDIVDSEQPAAQSAAEVIPLADKVSAKAASNDSPGLPETPVLEVSEEDQSEPEMPVADILETIEVEASKPESLQDPTPAEPDNKNREPEAILLTADEKVQSGTQSTAAGVEEAAPTGESEVPVEFAAAAADTTQSDHSSAPGDARAKTEMIRKQTEAQASVEAIEIEKAAQDLADAQKKQKAVQALKRKKLKLAQAQAQALKQKKLKLAQAQALKRKKAVMVKAQALKKQKAAQAAIEKAHREMAAGSNPPKVDNSNMIIQGRGANTKMLGLLKKYEGRTIGINYDNSADIKEAELVEANDEFFSVSVKDQKLNYSHPLKTILTIIEGEDGVGAGKPGQKEKFNAVIKVYPLALS